MMGLRVLNKHHCNFKNAFAVCFITAFAKNTCRAGLIQYGIILNLETMGEILQLNNKCNSIGFFVSITMHFSMNACLISFISFWGLLEQGILFVFSLQIKKHFYFSSFSRRFKIFLKTETFRGRSGKFKQRVIITEVSDILTKEINTQKIHFIFINQLYFFCI